MGSYVVAIDGPSASGKSSTARAVAKELGFAHLDSGALYRGVTLVALREGEAKGEASTTERLNPHSILDAAERRGLLLQYDGEDFAAYLDGEPVDGPIRSAQVTAHVSAVAALPEVREWVNGRLRALVRAGQPVVVDGRDIGTVVFPDAHLKVYLTASPRARAERRLAQRGEPVEPERVEEEAKLLAARDRADSSRIVAPLRSAQDAVLLDGTGLTLDSQVREIVRLVRERMGGWMDGQSERRDT